MLNVFIVIKLVKTAKTIPLAQVQHTHENPRTFKLIVARVQQGESLAEKTQGKTGNGSPTHEAH